MGLTDSPRVASPLREVRSSGKGETSSVALPAAGERRLGWAGEGAWARCASSCSWPALGFHANSSEARSLFQGCNVSIPEDRRRSLRDDGPSLIIIGTQKGG